jgi:bifunctional non-homologous end joining protein LigD
MLWRSTPTARRPAGFIEPCLPTLGHTVPSGPQWVHEIKHDGYRFICRFERGRVRVFSRGGADYTDRVPRIVDTLARLPATSGTLDGEGVACDANGVTDFELLRAALGRPAKREVFLYAFDLLELDRSDLRREPWSDRRWKLARLLRGAGHGVQLSDHVESSAIHNNAGRLPYLSGLKRTFGSAAAMSANDPKQNATRRHLSPQAPVFS